MAEAVVITAAVVGAEVTRAQNPAVPYTPEEIAAAAVAAGRAGAAVVHLHARWPDGRPSQEAAHFREIVDRIRAGGERRGGAVLHRRRGGDDPRGAAAGRWWTGPRWRRSTSAP